MPTTQDAFLSILLSRGDIFVGSILGVYRSRDGGVTWSNSSAGLDGIEVSALAERDGVLYAATHPKVFPTGPEGGGVWSSRDRGATWTPEVVGGCLSAVSLAVVREALLAATGCGVLRSLGEGQPWTYAGFEPGVRVFAAGGEVWASSISGLYRSANAGFTWHAAAVLGANLFTLVALGSRVVAGTDDGIRWTEDSGQSWNSATAGLHNTTVGFLTVSGDLVLGVLSFGSRDGALVRSGDAGYVEARRRRPSSAGNG